MNLPVEQRLLEALVELEAAANPSGAAGKRPGLVALFTRIDELAAELPPEGHAELRHFLQRKSYGKARRLLEGRRD